MIEAHPGNARLLNRIGDDAALWQPSRSHRSVITSDVLVEERHFRRDTMRLRDVGIRAMAANLSDLAAMGARPVLATVALGVPTDVSFEDVLELYGGILELCERHRCALAGGDLSGSERLFIAITAVGEVRPSNVKGRSGARPSDVAAVTGPLGASRAGLMLSRNAGMLAGELQEEAVAAHCRPRPRIAEGRWLAASGNVHAMMDISDGLSTDLARMSSASQCGAVITGIPLAASAVAAARAIGEESEQFALAGGEDFELLAAIDARAFRYLAGRFQKRFGRPLFQVGVFDRNAGVRLCRNGQEELLKGSGWDHFSDRPAAR